MSAKQTQKQKSDSPRVSRLRRMGDLLAELPDVENTILVETRVPPRLCVSLSTQEVPAGVEDVIEHFEASILSPRVVEGTLVFDVTATDTWKNGGTVDVRPNGNSVVASLVSKAREHSGIGVGDEVDVSAREGEIRITRHGEKPQ